MKKTILVTGATDGIGLETAKMLVSAGHDVLLHGRNREKLENVVKTLSGAAGSGLLASYVADLSSMAEVSGLADEVIEHTPKLDVLINNAGVFMASAPTTGDGLDVRFAVNTVAPYLLTQKLLPLMNPSGRVVNLSSAAQAPVDPDALKGIYRLVPDGAAYAQSKLALTMWSCDLALSLGSNGPAIIAVNPKSFLGTKMVREAYGAEGSDLRIGAEILFRAALSDEFADVSGEYFDNDLECFSNPHPDALDHRKCREITSVIEMVLVDILDQQHTGEFD